mgnify:CR=1 FL=1
MSIRNFLIIGFILTSLSVSAQFPPPAGVSGTTAIPRDSACFKSWATGCTVTRGFVNISDTTITYLGNNRAYYGDDTDGLGQPDDSVVSLGDGGTATLTFSVVIGNGSGPDFAVFENGLSDTFLELAFVEVSSNGTRFVRFPAISNTPTTSQISTFGSVDATLINNFAGKYRRLFGTPFDLEDIKDSSDINVNHITHVRLVDAIGCIQPEFASFDSRDSIVNEPWPTPFHSCGFDLDAVGVINISAESVGNISGSPAFMVYPNPVSDYVSVSGDQPEFILTVNSMSGQPVIDRLTVTHTTKIRMADLPAGLYLFQAVFQDGRILTQKVLKK